MKVEEWLGANNTIGIDIFKKKYLQEGETFDQWLDRVSGGDKDVKKLILEKKFLFGGRILSNRGRNIGTLSNCYVIGLKDDSIESIYDVAKASAQTYKAGGGVGIDITKLAPKGAKVNNAAKTTSGAVSFIDLFTTTTGLIGQNGRRGALMVSIGCDHPDIEDFISLKTDVNKATTANLSIRVSDDFMNAVVNGEKWITSFTRPETGETITKEYDAKELFQKFCDANYDYGEPGLLFWDRIEEYNLVSKYKEFKFAGVNPCAEEPLPDGGACLLGSMNLATYVKDGDFDYTTFGKDVKVAIKALNDVQEEGISQHPLDKQQKMARDWRQVGLGIMGLGDLFIKMNVAYGSPKSLEIADHIGKCMAVNALQASISIGETKPFPKFDKKNITNSSFYKEHLHFDCESMANSQLLTIAPTGTISTMLGVSGGIEPLFALEYERTTKSLHSEEFTYKVIPPIVQEARDKGMTDGLVCSADIDYNDRIRMQAVWQKHIDASISSTINLPENFPREKIADLYISAWRAGLKGVTVFRDGCKRVGILKTKEETIPNEHEIIGIRKTVQTGCGKLHVVGMFDRETGNLAELYLNRGREGGCQSFMVGLSRMTSLAARNGVPIEDIVDQLTSCTTCPSYAVRRAVHKDTAPGNCCPTAVGNALIEMRREVMGLEFKQKPITIESPIKKEGDVCPECGAKLVHENGCISCKSCGAYSKCD